MLGALTSTTFLMAAEVMLLAPLEQAACLRKLFLEISRGGRGGEVGQAGVVGYTSKGPPDHRMPHNNTREKTTTCKMSLMSPTWQFGFFCSGELASSPPSLGPHHHLSVASITTPFALIHLLSLPTCYCSCSQPWQARINKWCSAC